MTFAVDIAHARDAFPLLTRKPAFLLIILGDATGMVVPRERILDKFDAHYRTTGDDNAINTTLKHLRKALRGSDVRIDTVNGIGLMLVAPPGWVKPWAAPAPKTAAIDGHWPGRLQGD